MKTRLVVAVATVMLVAGCANPPATEQGTTAASTVSAAAAVGTVTFVYDPVGGCFNNKPYVYLTRPQTGITYLINGAPADRDGQLITTSGTYHITAVGMNVIPSTTGPWDITVAATC